MSIGTNLTDDCGEESPIEPSESVGLEDLFRGGPRRGDRWTVGRSLGTGFYYFRRNADQTSCLVNMIKLRSSAQSWKRTTSPMEADNMWLTGARWGGVGRVCLRVSYVTKNIAANEAGNFVNPRCKL